MPPRRNLKPVEPFRFTQLLHDVENLGGRHKVRPGAASLKNLCDKKVEVFGDFGTNLRRAIQKKFSGIQRLSTEQYVHLLHENGITPSTETAQLHRQELRANVDTENQTVNSETTTASSTVNSIVSSSSSSSSSATDSSLDDPSDDEDLTEAEEATTTESSEVQDSLQARFKNLSFAKPSVSLPRPTMNLSPGFGFSSPASRSGIGSPLPVSSHGQLQLPNVSVPSTLIHHEIRGTFEKPHILAVDPDRPFNNREFAVHAVPNVQRNGFTHTCFVISKIVPLPDHEVWEAYAANVSGHPNRAVLIQGPSGGGYYQNNPDMIKAYVEKAAYPEQERTGLSTSQLAVTEGQYGDYEWWLLIFPPGYELNHLFLSTPSRPEGALEKLPVALPSEFSDEDTKLPIGECKLAFIIALAAKRQKSQNTVEKVRVRL